VSDMTPCFEFAGYRNRSGYGVRKKRRAGGSTLVHRQEWEAAHGPIPSGLEVMHLCDNPPCYRLDHLRLGTHAENMADSKAKGRATNGHRGRTECSNGHPYTPENTYIRPDSTRDCMACRRLRVAAYTRRKRAKDAAA
jgi:hypothetical protein